MDDGTLSRKFEFQKWKVKRGIGRKALGIRQRTFLRCFKLKLVFHPTANPESEGGVSWMMEVMMPRRIKENPIQLFILLGRFDVKAKSQSSATHIDITRMRA